MQIRILTSVAELRGVSQDWMKLYARSAAATSFQHPEWLMAWIEAFRPRDLKVVEFRAEGALAGIAPLLIYPRNGERVLAFAGGGVSDYLDVLVAPEFEEHFDAAMLEAVDRIEGWDVFELTDLPSNSILLRTGLANYSAPHDQCSSLLLPGTNEELLQLLSKRQRANFRNAQSRLRKVGGGSIESATAETLAEFIDDLFRLHSNRWAQRGENGVLADDAVQTFHRTVAPGLLARGILRFYRLRSGARTVAALYTLHNRKTVFCYMQGFDPDFAHVSPGTQLLLAAVRDAVELGRSKFDFLRGEESYKQHWRVQPESTFRIHLSRSAVTQMVCGPQTAFATEQKIAS